MHIEYEHESQCVLCLPAFFIWALPIFNELLHLLLLFSQLQQLQLQHSGEQGSVTWLATG